MTESAATETIDNAANSGENPARPELRTFLFADIRGYTRFTQERGDEEATRLVAKFLGIMRAIVADRGGTLLEIRGDEALVIFGSARQALRAAVDLQARYGQESDADPDLPLRVGIGIDTGEAIPFEGGYRGEALNLAARLCNLAGPGEVLASEGVVYLGRSAEGITYAERGTVPIKGFADPVRVIRVVDEAGWMETGPRARSETSTAEARDQHETPPPIGGYLGALPSGALVGRDSDWERVMAGLETVMQGTGQLVMLSGEPGIGKTRVAQEVMLKARHWGFVVVTGRCYEQEQSVPYYPFLEALATLYDVCPPSVRADIPRRWPQLGRLLSDQLGIVPPPVTRGLEQEDQHLLFRAVTGFVEAIAESMPVAFLLDDLHWADDASVKLLLYLTRYTRGRRVLLLGTYRDADIHLEHPLAKGLLDVGR
ncbi:MAG TPA: adenylate/guanylate cyclase domain-containing protein, partial [Chloroflexota bacterium]|nr:adenylate/guanylate cyclase domain-containing protein [Chloroflexota bacterium]